MKYLVYLVLFLFLDVDAYFMLGIHWGWLPLLLALAFLARVTHHMMFHTRRVQ